MKKTIEQIRDIIKISRNDYSLDNMYLRDRGLHNLMSFPNKLIKVKSK